MEELHSDGQETIDSLVTLLKMYIPSDWKRLVQKYRALGHSSQAPAMVWDIDDNMYLWRPPPGVSPLFERLRDTMSRPGRGAWLSADLTLRFPGGVDLDYFWNDDAGWGDRVPGARRIS